MIIIAICLLEIFCLNQDLQDFKITGFGKKENDSWTRTMEEGI